MKSPVKLLLIIISIINLSSAGIDTIGQHTINEMSYYPELSSTGRKRFKFFLQRIFKTRYGKAKKLHQQVAPTISIDNELLNSYNKIINNACSTVARFVREFARFSSDGITICNDCRANQYNADIQNYKLSHPNELFSPGYFDLRFSPSPLLCTCKQKIPASQKTADIYHALYDTRGLLRCFNFSNIAALNLLPYNQNSPLHTEAYTCFRIFLNEWIGYDSEYFNQYRDKAENTITLIIELTEKNGDIFHQNNDLTDINHYDHLIFDAIYHWASDECMHPYSTIAMFDCSGLSNPGHGQLLIDILSDYFKMRKIHSIRIQHDQSSQRILHNAALKAQLCIKFCFEYYSLPAHSRDSISAEITTPAMDDSSTYLLYTADEMWENIKFRLSQQF